MKLHYGRFRGSTEITFAYWTFIFENFSVIAQVIYTNNISGRLGNIFDINKYNFGALLKSIVIYS